jgi:hypothetical protein
MESGFTSVSSFQNSIKSVRFAVLDRNQVVSYPLNLITFKIMEYETRNNWSKW